MGELNLQHCTNLIWAYATLLGPGLGMLPTVLQGERGGGVHVRRAANRKAVPWQQAAAGGRSQSVPTIARAVPTAAWLSPPPALQRSRPVWVPPSSTCSRWPTCCGAWPSRSAATGRHGASAWARCAGKDWVGKSCGVCSSGGGGGNGGGLFVGWLVGGWEGRGCPMVVGSFRDACSTVHLSANCTPAATSCCQCQTSPPAAGGPGSALHRAACRGSYAGLRQQFKAGRARKRPWTAAGHRANKTVPKLCSLPAVA